MKYLARISMIQYGIAEVEAESEKKAKEKAIKKVEYGKVVWTDREITDITLEESDEKPSEIYLTEREAEIVLAIAENNMNVSNASRKIFTHRRAIEYHMEKINKKTGLNPKKFYDLLILLQNVSRNEAAKSEN